MRLCVSFPVFRWLVLTNSGLAGAPSASRWLAYGPVEERRSGFYPQSIKAVVPRSTDSSSAGSAQQSSSKITPVSSAGQGVDPFDPRRPFTRAQARRAGIPLRTLLGSTFHKVVWDQYVSREVPVTTKVRAQSALRLSPPGSHVSHHTAAELWGAVAPAQSCTHVTLPSVNGRLVRAGIKSHYGGPRAATTLKGLPISTPEQTFLDLASVGVELVDLVIVADGLIKQERTTTAQLMAAAGSWQGRGRPLAVRAAGLARAGVDSVQETRVRLLVVLAGLPEPKVNVIMRAEDGEWRRRYDMGVPGVEDVARVRRPPTRRGPKAVAKRHLPPRRAGSNGVAAHRRHIGWSLPGAGPNARADSNRIAGRGSDQAAQAIPA